MLSLKRVCSLGAGSVIHALHGEQDIRNMGGLKKWMPITFWTFMISSLAISGIFPFSGFFSKDEILAATFAHNKVIWGIASLASLMTAFLYVSLGIFDFYRHLLEAQKSRSIICTSLLH
jgi:NADH-quinone oxidoreductase subunit L